jgi:flagellar biogenesis protein FliO
MRKFLPTILSLASAIAGAQGFLGTKESGSPASLDATPGTGIGPFLQMVIALGIVLALVKFILPKIATKVGKKLVASPTSGLRVEETAHFAGGTLYIVQARSKTLLLGVNGASVSCLADLTEAPQAVPDPPTFQEIVETAMEQPVSAVAFAPQRDSDEVEEALRRLERLVG